jgi:phosphate transport system permease protein
VTQGAGLAVLLLLVAIGVFLGLRATRAFDVMGWGFFTEKLWIPSPPTYGIAALAFGTVVSSLLALVIAVPVAIGTALFLTEVLRQRVGRPLGYIVDLLAAVPSVVFGLWGFLVLAPTLVPVERFLDRWLGFIPIFDNRANSFGSGKSLFTGGVVLAIMIVPIIAALAREIFNQVPRGNREAAQALGATPWETIRVAVLPFSRTGLVGSTMLGLGRALGETIAVALIFGASFAVNIHVTETGGNSIAANIATKFGEADEVGRAALIASGLVLFAITLAVNIVGRLIVRRSVVVGR